MASSDSTPATVQEDPRSPGEMDSSPRVTQEGENRQQGEDQKGTAALKAFQGTKPTSSQVAPDAAVPFPAFPSLAVGGIGGLGERTISCSSDEP